MQVVFNWKRFVQQLNYLNVTDLISLYPPLASVAYINSRKLRFSLIRVRCGTQRSIANMLRKPVRKLKVRHSVTQIVSLQRHSPIKVILRVPIQGIVRVSRFSPRTNEICSRWYAIEYRQDTSNIKSLPRQNSPLKDQNKYILSIQINIY